jgi:hypothetical protein
MNRSIQTILICFFSLCFIFFLWNPAAQAKANKKYSVDDEYQQMHRETDVMKIVSVLEMKVENQKLLEKAKEKISTLREPEFSLITSLSDQIVKEGGRPGADIAFLLLIALIILS